MTSLDTMTTTPLSQSLLHYHHVGDVRTIIMSVTCHVMMMVCHIIHPSSRATWWSCHVMIMSSRATWWSCHVMIMSCHHHVPCHAIIICVMVMPSSFVWWHACHHHACDVCATSSWPVRDGMSHQHHACDDHVACIKHVTSAWYHIIMRCHVRWHMEHIMTFVCTLVTNFVVVF